MNTELPRGIRNNNPGNIRRGADHWLGMKDEQDDPEFIQFRSMAYGVRALALLLRAYERAHGLKTINGIIHRWAPPIENNTSAYVTQVAHLAGYGPDEAIDLEDWVTMRTMICAIIMHENGMLVSRNDIDQGLTLAGMHRIAPAV